MPILSKSVIVTLPVKTTIVTLPVKTTVKEQGEPIFIDNDGFAQYAHIGQKDIIGTAVGFKDGYVEVLLTGNSSVDIGYETSYNTIGKWELIGNQVVKINDTVFPIKDFKITEGVYEVYVPPKPKPKPKYKKGMMLHEYIEMTKKEEETPDPF